MPKIDFDKLGLNDMPDELKENLKLEYVPEKESRGQPKLEDAPEEIQNLELITENIIAILEYIAQPEMQELEKKDFVNFKHHMEQKFDEFSLRYITMFNMLLDANNRDANILKLLDMISLLKEVQNGKKDLHTEFNKLKDNLTEEYIYKPAGGKEAYEEKIIRNHQRKENRARKSMGKNRKI